MTRAPQKAPTKPLADRDALYEIVYGEYREIQDRGARQSFVGSTMAVHLESASRCRILHHGDVLAGGEVPPEFRLSIDELLGSVTRPV